MAELKTKKNDASVADFVNAIADAQVREDCRAIVDMMKSATKSEPKMYGANIVGFGTSRVVYANGKEVDWMNIGFSPRKQNITLYILDESEETDELTSKLGAHSRGKGCLYIKRLSDVHVPTLKKLVRAAVERRSKKSSQT